VKFCHIVFFRASERTTRAVIAQFRKSSVLLVGENKEFLNDGGMINLILNDGKMSYELNTAALERAQVRYQETSGAEAPEMQGEGSRSIAFRVAPEYPRIAVSLKIIGAVKLQAVVRADGTVRKVRVVGGHPVLAEAAIAAVMKWRFEAAAKETTESVTVSFGE
jgi:TonB family protein